MRSITAVQGQHTGVISEWSGKSGETELIRPDSRNANGSKCGRRLVTTVLGVNIANGVQLWAPLDWVQRYGANLCSLN